MLKDELEVLSSEVPVSNDKQNYKYLEKGAGNGAYYQVAWQKTSQVYRTLWVN
ncbi:hypothetical protein [Leuconostoc suionicum]|uniref:hypothetical protein n=1 Tax=Leuconostoc suionicum TaxID=1511761 RepID=UPI0032E039F7